MLTSQSLVLIVVELVEIDWPYLAGFTDGDGCIHVKRRQSPPYKKGSVTYEMGWFQSDSACWVLEEIKSFLERNGMVVTWRTAKQTKLGKQPMHTIKIYRKDDVRRAIQEMLPYLIVKRAVALDALEVIGKMPTHPNEIVYRG